MNEIESIVNNCEDLVVWEIELENKLRVKSLLLEGQKQFSQITKRNNLVDKIQPLIDIKKLQDEISTNNYLYGQLSKVEEFIKELEELQLQTKVSTKESGLTTRFKRQLSLSAETQGNSKSVKLVEL